MELTTAAQAATKTPEWWPWIAAVLGSSVLGGLITATLGNVRAAAEARREGYARAVRTLIARSEYPYRVRRRVSDEAAVLAALADRGHDVQEQLAACRTWVNAENRTLGRLFDDVVTDLDRGLGPATRDAWGQPPITTAAGMALGGWGPGDPWPHLKRLQHAITFRFGWRRSLVPSWVVRWWVTRAAGAPSATAPAPTAALAGDE